MTMVEVTQDGPVAVITLKNPPMNVLCSQLLQELDAALVKIVEEKQTLAIVVTGEGRAFVAGADIKEMMDMDPGAARIFADNGQGALNKLDNIPIPTIAAINGFALGGGCELALACDIRVASEAAKFGQPEVNLGVIPGFGGTQRLARAIGPGKAKELIFTGDIVGTKEALQFGLIQAVVDGYKKDENGELVKNEKGKPVPDNGPVMDYALKMAKKIATKGPVAVATAKNAINKGLTQPLPEGLVTEASEFSDLFSTADQKEGMLAFVEKRTAEFSGK